MNPNNQQQLGMNFNTGMGFPAMNMQFQATDPNSNQPQQANFQMNMGGFGFGMSGPFTDPNQQPQQQQFPLQKNFQQPTQQFPQQQQPQQFPQQQQPQQFPQQQPQQFPQQQPQQFPQQQPQQFPQQQAQQFPQQQPKQFPQQQPQQFPQQQPQHFPQQQPQQFPQQQPQHFPQQQPQQFPQQQQQQPFQQMPQVQVQFQMPQQPQGFQQPQQQQFNPPPQQMQQPQFNQGGFGPQQFNHLNKKVQNYEWSASSKHPYFDHKLKGICKRSKLAGNVYANRPCFDDFFGSEIHKEFHDPEITAITVYYTHQGIVGIQCDYKNLTKSFQGACHKGFHKGPVESKTIKFSFGEHIESIKGRAGQYIERLDIKTDSNQEISVGGNGGQPFGNILTGGYPTVWAFGGSLGEYLESIYALYQ